MYTHPELRINNRPFSILKGSTGRFGVSVEKAPGLLTPRPRREGTTQWSLNQLPDILNESCLILPRPPILTRLPRHSHLLKNRMSATPRIFYYFFFFKHTKNHHSFCSFVPMMQQRNISLLIRF